MGIKDFPDLQNVKITKQKFGQKSPSEKSPRKILEVLENLLHCPDTQPPGTKRPGSQS
jgi:hypothetical protein